MYIPPQDEFGIRRTVNYGLSSAQTVWNLRSALNVAALNCRSAEHVDILPAYSLLLERDKRALARTNDAITGEFRAQYGREFRTNFDNYMTQVYNYFALPPTQAEFCDTALAISREYMLLPEGAQLDHFALANLPRIEGVFQNFYSAYERYRQNVAAWDAEYAPPPPVLVSGYPRIGPATGGSSTNAADTIYTVDVAPSVADQTAMTGPAVSGEPVVVYGLPSLDSEASAATGLGQPDDAPALPDVAGTVEPLADPATTVLTDPGFSISDPLPADTTGQTIVFESGEVVQPAPEEEEDGDDAG